MLGLLPARTFSRSGDNAASQSQKHKGYLISSVDLIHFPHPPLAGKKFILDLSCMKTLSKSCYGENARKTQVWRGNESSDAKVSYLSERDEQAIVLDTNLLQVNARGGR
jgi:hypothetical protein